MKELVFFLEEQSAKALLETIFLRLNSADVAVRYIVFEGKNDLTKQLERRMRGYLNKEARFIVLQDQDAKDCHSLKAELKDRCHMAGRPDAIVRIACHEIESWYLADLAAVGLAFKKTGLAGKQAGEKYRNPDSLGNPVQELRRLVPEYQKVGGSRLIGHHLTLDNDRSKSFYHLLQAVKLMLKDE